MEAALKKLGRLVYSVATLDNNEAVNVSVQFLRELIAATDSFEKTRFGDIELLKTERAINAKIIDQLSEELARRTRELYRAEAALDSMYTAIDKMGDRWAALQLVGDLTMVGMTLDFTSLVIAQHLKWGPLNRDDDRPTNPPDETVQNGGA